jgi:hypothetical protein
MKRNFTTAIDVLEQITVGKSKDRLAVGVPVDSSIKTDFDKEQNSKTSSR